MIIVHHLNNSRSQRILWLLEELGLEHEIVKYERDAKTRLAPPELKGPHPLGKSPVIQDGALTLAESGAIVEYLTTTYGGGRFAPAPRSADWPGYIEWLHFAEGSAMLPLMLLVYMMRLKGAGAPLFPRIQSELTSHLDYVAKALGERAFLVGEALTGADVMMSFVLEGAEAAGALAAHPSLERYLARLHARDAWKRALAKGGPYSVG